MSEPTMWAFVWDETNGVTTNWHHEGGLVIIAPTLAAARAAWNTAIEEPEQAEAVEPEPDHTWELADSTTKPAIIIHPNAGCC